MCFNYKIIFSPRFKLSTKLKCKSRHHAMNITIITEYVFLENIQIQDYIIK